MPKFVWLVRCDTCKESIRLERKTEAKIASGFYTIMDDELVQCQQCIQNQLDQLKEGGIFKI